MSVLEDKRREIDEIDAKIIELLARRMRAAQRIGGFKKRARLPKRDEKREKLVMNRALKLARENGLPRKLVERIFKQILAQNAQNKGRRV